MRWKLLGLLASSAWLATAGGGEDRQAPPPKGSAPITSGGPRILVVESHSLVGAAIGGLLGGPPLDALVETVLDTQTAMARLDAADFDLVVCELSDPPKRATELVARLAARGSDVPVVFLADVEEELRAMGGEVASDRVGMAVLERLRALDHVAYLRFASVYKGFEDLSDFEREVGELQKHTEPKPR